MRADFKTAAFLVLIAVAATVGAAETDEPQPVERLSLTADDLAGALNLNIYKFRVPMRSETKFDIVVSVQDSPDAEPRVLSRQSLRHRGDAESVDLRLSFLPRDDSVRGVLLTQDEEVVYRVKCSGCSPGGFATIIPLPLREIPGTEKTLMPVNAEVSAELSDEGETCLIAILASEVGKPASTKTSYPRAKISVQIAE